MRKGKIFGLAVLLSVLLSVSFVFGLGIVDVSKLPWGSPSSTAGGGPGSTTVFVDPANITYETNMTGSFVTFHVNISDVTDLFTWQINMSWNPSILNVSDTVAGEFLLRTGSEHETAAFQIGYVINATDYDEGYTCMSESILGEVSGEGGGGRLVSIEFEVVGYGHTYLTISVSGNLTTTLLDNAGGTITFDTTDGYFRNTIPGDMVGDPPDYGPPDGDVDRYDFGEFMDAYPSIAGDPEYNILADLVGDPPDYGPPDGDIDRYDFGVFMDNYPT